MSTSLIPLVGDPAFQSHIHHHHGPGGLLFLLAVIAFVVLLREGRLGPLAWKGGTPHRPEPTDAALATLRDRLASGDITTEEYSERVSVLNSARTTASPDAETR